MTLTDSLTIIAILVSPIIAVIVTLWYSNRLENRKAKMELFMTLLANRKTYPVPIDFVNSLNTIDVVFHNNEKVITAWKNLYSEYHTEPFQITRADRKLLDLLDAMAKNLGYMDIRQTDFDSFYAPRLFENQRQFQEEVNTELLRVLKGSVSFGYLTQSGQSSERKI